MCSGDSYKAENADDGKAKTETPVKRTARLERERDQRTSSYFRFLVGVAILGFHARQFFFLITSHKPFFILSYIITVS